MRVRIHREGTSGFEKSIVKPHWPHLRAERLIGMRLCAGHQKCDNRNDGEERERADGEERRSMVFGRRRHRDSALVEGPTCAPEARKIGLTIITERRIATMWNRRRWTRVSGVHAAFAEGAVVSGSRTGISLGVSIVLRFHVPSLAPRNAAAYCAGGNVAMHDAHGSLLRHRRLTQHDHCS